MQLVQKEKNILIVGLGLIGGSYAKGLKKLGFRVTAALDHILLLFHGFLSLAAVEISVAGCVKIHTVALVCNEEGNRCMRVTVL